MSRWRQREWSTLKPRYTSYPTADRFVEAFGAQDYRQALRQRAKGGVVGGAAPLSIYVHIPFCKSVCYYCACNKIITKHHERGRAYLQSLAAEIDLHTAELGRGQSVSQLHLGGGSPTFLTDDELSDLMDMLRGAFVLSPRAEVSIEVDPRTADPQRLQHLAAGGFNRISFGIQDFDPAVQAAVHRVQSFESVQALMGQAKALGFQSMNANLIYGLPMQTPESFQRTVAQVAELRPHRTASRSTPMRTCRNASSRSAASRAPTCRVGATYSQNAKTLPECTDALSQGCFPVVRGLALTRDDLMRRSVIMALMCQGRLDFESIDLAHLVDTRSLLAPELARLQPLVEMGLVELSPAAVQITPTGWFYVRAAAMVFDRHLHADANHHRFLRIL